MEIRTYLCTLIYNNRFIKQHAEQIRSFNGLDTGNKEIEREYTTNTLDHGKAELKIEVDVEVPSRVTVDLTPQRT